MLPIEKRGIVEKVRKSDFGMQSQLISAWITLLLSNAECLKVRDFGWVKLAKVFYQILFFFWPACTSLLRAEMTCGGTADSYDLVSEALSQGTWKLYEYTDSI